MQASRQGGGGGVGAGEDVEQHPADDGGVGDGAGCVGRGAALDGEEVVEVVGVVGGVGFGAGEAGAELGDAEVGGGLEGGWAEAVEGVFVKEVVEGGDLADLDEGVSLERGGEGKEAYGGEVVEGLLGGGEEVVDVAAFVEEAFFDGLAEGQV